MPDAKRAYNMNIALSRFNKLTFIEMRDAILDLDRSVSCSHKLIVRRN